MASWLEGKNSTVEESGGEISHQPGIRAGRPREKVLGTRRSPVKPLPVTCLIQSVPFGWWQIDPLDEVRSLWSSYSPKAH